MQHNWFFFFHYFLEIEETYENKIGKKREKLNVCKNTCINFILLRKKANCLIIHWSVTADIVFYIYPCLNLYKIIIIITVTYTIHIL